MALPDGEISDGLLLTAVEMGEAVTESGATSAVSGFFRRTLDACAWSEDGTDATTHQASRSSFFPVFPTAAQHWRSSGSSLGASTGDPHDPPLLRIPLDTSCAGDPDEVAVHGSRRTPLELVVSRGAGPRFSEHEVRVSHLAAVLLGQALARIRTWSALAETKLALEKSFQGMAEASTAVAVLVDEREKLALRETELRADVKDEHERALHASGEELRQVSTEATGLQRRLVEVERSMAVLAGAMSDCFRVATDLKDGSRDGEEVEEEEGETDDLVTGKLVVVIENAAREALPCCVARVKRNEVTSTETLVTQAREVGTIRTGARQESSSSAGRHREWETRLNESELKDVATSVPSLQIPVPHCNLAGTSPPPPLTLSLRQDVDSSRVFTAGEKALASALASSLGTALLVLREKQRHRKLALALDADRKARSRQHEEAVTAAAAAATNAQERSDRAVAGMKTLASSARASKAQAQGEAAATRRAEKHADALRHLLAGLDKGGGDHARVAKVVAERAADAVPACMDAVLLTPRRDSGRGVDFSGRRGDFGCGTRRETAAVGCNNNPALFSPDPRVWAASTAASRSGNGDGHPRRRCKRWAGVVERAASQAATTGKAVCVQDTTAVGVPASSGRIFCFSPVPVFPSFLNLPLDSTAGVLSGSSGRRTGNTSSKPWRRNLFGDSSCCVIALVLCIRMAQDGGSDDGNDPPCSDSPASVESRPADKTRHATELPWISHAIEGVIHAVSLALSASIAAHDDDLIIQQKRPSIGGAPAGLVEFTGYTNNRHGGEAENAHKWNSRNRGEVEKLRDGTSSLAKRVQMLEGKAAGLRASEARSSASLARARADAMAIRGELQLVSLERDRLLCRLHDKGDRGEDEGLGQDRKPLVAQPSRDNVRGPLLRGDLERPLSFLDPTSTNNSSPFSMASRWDVAKRRTCEVYPPLGAATLRSTLPAVVDQFSKVSFSGAARSGGHAPGVGKHNAEHLGPSGDVSVGAAGAAGAAAMTPSEALKWMASVHARLSDSLRHGISASAVVQNV